MFWGQQSSCNGKGLRLDGEGPFYLDRLPFLYLDLQPGKDDGNGRTRVLQQTLDDGLALFAAVELLDHALVDGGALAAKTRREGEVGALLLRHSRDALCDGLEELHRSQGGLYVVVVVVPLFFDAVQGLLEPVLAVGHEARVLRRPGRVRRPLVVQHAPAHLIPAAAGLQGLLVKLKRQ